MSINNQNTYLNIEDAHLRLRTGNVYAQGITIGGITVDPSHGLQRVSDTGNVTSNTLQFANATTAFVTTANVTVGRDLTVTGNATVSSNLTVTGNAVISDDLTVTENLLVSNNLTVTGNTFYTNPASVLVDSNVVTEYTGPHDRPLRKYPEVAMTSATTGGYTVTESGTPYPGGYQGWRAFDEVSTTEWISDQTARYSTSTPFNANSPSTDGLSGISGVSGTRAGSWIKLELPRKIRLEKTEIFRRDVSDQRFDQAYVYGSNDDTNWYQLSSITNPTYGQPANASGDMGPSIISHSTDTITPYKYFVIQITSLVDNVGTANIGQAYFYGYEEGSGSLDTTLKTVYNVPATTGTQLEVYYDGRETSSYSGSGTTVTDISPNTNNGTLNGGVGFDSTYKAFTFDGTDDYIEGTVTTGTGAWSHSIAFWFKMDQLPSLSVGVFQIKDSSVADNADAADHTSPHLVINSDGTLNNAFTGNPGNFLDDNGNQLVAQIGVWQHYVVQYDASNGGTNYRDRKLIINGNKEYYPAAGTATALNMVASNKLFIGCLARSTGFDYLFNGSIANFRIYNKILNADQVKELYDYQKDYFLGSKSQVTLYKGHLGVGVTEPSGQLELAGDERIQEYPPRDLGGFETLVEGQGTYKVSSSSDVTNPSLGGNDHPATAFTANDTFFRGVTNKYDFTSVPAPYTGTDFTNGVGGDFLQIELPHKINLKSINITARTSSSLIDRAPYTGFIFGSNDSGTTWSQVTSWNGLTWTVGESKSIQINSNTLYSTYRLVANKLLNSSGSASRFNIDRWQLFGTPGPTTLDKGSLTLGRSLDVPRISRYDVDTETPRPEKLVLDFDTTVNSSPTDISGKGNHGVFKGTAQYSSAEKAFSFDGNSDYIQGTLNLNGSELDGSYTLSTWVKRSSTTNTEAHFFYIGVNGAGDSIGFRHNSSTSYRLYHYDQGTTEATSQPGNLNEWRHYVATYDGTNRQMYIDGVLVDVTDPAPTGSLGIPNNPTFSLGMRYANLSNGSEYLHGYMSNPKIYNVALEPSEVKKLYNLGRTGRSMVISDTAVGIGKVPEAQLDVRGNINSDGIMTNKNYMFWATGPSPVNTQNDHPTTQIVADFSLLEFDLGGGFDTSTKTYTIPCSGYWEFDYCILARNRAAGVNYVMGRWLINGSILDKRTFVYFVGTGSGSQESDLVGKIIGYYTAGTTVAVQIVQDSANTDAYMSPNYSFFYGKMLH